MDFFQRAFFTVSLIAGNYFENAVLTTTTKTDARHPKYLKSLHSSIDLPFNLDASQTIPMSLYFGPNSFKRVEGV